MTTMPPLDLIEPQDRCMAEAARKGADASGMPFISYFAPAEMGALAHEASFHAAQHMPAVSLAERCFSGRVDGLRPLGGDDILFATT